ncbi:hypothetical protein MPLSOD_200015 [Mesorhizobium sp. SOD10]|nr:hypothetical protein MPLSOD_200015 [Mesorhizobium sp. SOD10]
MTTADKHREVVPSRRQRSPAFLRRCARRPTSNTAACSQLLFAGPYQHVNAEALHRRLTPIDVEAPPATIYNTQNHFRKARPLRDLNVAAPHGYFEIDTVDRHHFLLDEKQLVIDIPCSANCPKGVARTAQIADIDPAIRMTKRVGQGLPVPPDGRAIWKPRRPSSHVRHACRVDVTSAQTEKPCQFSYKRST